MPWRPSPLVTTRDDVLITFFKCQKLLCPEKFGSNSPYQVRQLHQENFLLQGYNQVCPISFSPTLPMQAHNPTPKIMYPLSTYNYGNPGHYYDPLQFPVSVSSQMESPYGYCEVPPSQLYVLQPQLHTYTLSSTTHGMMVSPVNQPNVESNDTLRTFIPDYQSHVNQITPSPKQEYHYAIVNFAMKCHWIINKFLSQ